MERMKKAISLLLVVAMLLTNCLVTAFACYETRKDIAFCGCCCFVTGNNCGNNSCGGNGRYRRDNRIDRDSCVAGNAVRSECGKASGEYSERCLPESSGLETDLCTRSTSVTG